MLDASLLGQQTIRRANRLWARLATSEALWQELAEFLLPRKSNVTLQRVEGARQTERLFDGTAIHALELLAATMQDALTSNASRWFSLKMRTQALNQVKAVQDWLEECEDRMYLAIRQSNFGPEAHEVYLDLGAFGIGCLLVDEKPVPVGERTAFGGLLFRALPIAEYAIDEAADGMVDVLVRRFELSARAVRQQWGEEQVSEQVRELCKADTGFPETPVTIIHLVAPREGYSSAEVAGKKPWTSCYVEAATTHVLSEGGFDEFPFLVPRWTKTSGEIYGRGPGHTALPDTRSLNRAVELSFKGTA